MKKLRKLKWPRIRYAPMTREELLYTWSYLADITRAYSSKVVRGTNDLAMLTLHEGAVGIEIGGEQESDMYVVSTAVYFGHMMSIPKGFDPAQDLSIWSTFSVLGSLRRTLGRCLERMAEGSAVSSWLDARGWHFHGFDSEGEGFGWLVPVGEFLEQRACFEPRLVAIKSAATTMPWQHLLPKHGNGFCVTELRARRGLLRGKDHSALYSIPDSAAASALRAIIEREQRAA